MYNIKRKKKNRIIVRCIVNMLVLSLIVSLNWLGLFTVGETVAYYFDIEVSGNNLLAADDLDFIVESNEEVCQVWKTYTQGGWGAKAKGNNPGKYRDQHFDDAFPSGAIIGNTSGFKALFTTAAVIKNFLPAEGTPQAFNQNYTNPASTSAGILAGQALALTLSLGFDAYDENFSPSELPLSGWEVSGGPSQCNGKTVQTILDETNKVLADLSSIFSASQANECAMYINERFNGGRSSCEKQSCNTDDLDWGESNTLEATVTEVLDGVNWKYRVRAEETAGYAPFCNILHVEAFLNGDSVYDGSLMSFVSPTAEFTPLDDDWKFLVKIPQGAPYVPKGKICKYDFIFEGWQNDFPVYPNGFNDIEKLENEIQSGTYVSPIVINEFLPNPTGADNNTMPFGEWVELYNNSTDPLDLNGWHLYDNLNSHPLEITSSNSDNNGNVADAGETIIPGNGYLIVYLNQAYSPGWLNNSGGDKIRLYNGTVGSSTLIDQYSFGGFIPANKSYARIPDGIGDFVDPIPTPLAANVLDEPIVLVNSDTLDQLLQTEDPMIEDIQTPAETATLPITETTAAPETEISSETTEEMQPETTTDESPETKAIDESLEEVIETEISLPEEEIIKNSIEENENSSEVSQESLTEEIKEPTEADINTPEEIIAQEEISLEEDLLPEISETSQEIEEESLPEIPENSGSIEEVETIEEEIIETQSSPERILLEEGKTYYI